MSLTHCFFGVCDMKAWQAKLINALDARRWNAADLAKASGVSVRMLQRYINKGAEVPISKAIAIANALGLTVDEVFVPGATNQTVKTLERLLYDLRNRVPQTGQTTGEKGLRDGKKMVRDIRATPKQTRANNRRNKAVNNGKSS